MIAGFRSKNHPQQVKARGADDVTDDRRTPDLIFKPLAEEFGFTLDAAASERNARCERYFDRESDGLRQSWGGAHVWCNPPYSACGAWVRKALRECASGSCPLAVLLLPANRCEQPWWQELIEPFRDRALGLETRFLRGRPRFGWPDGRVTPTKGDRPPFGLVVVIVRAWAKLPEETSLFADQQEASRKDKQGEER